MRAIISQVSMSKRQATGTGCCVPACMCVIGCTGLDVEAAGNWIQVSPWGAYE